MSRLPAFQVLSGMVVEPPGEGYLAHVLYVEQDDTWATLHLKVAVPKTHPVEVVGDPFENLTDELEGLEGWAGA